MAFRVQARWIPTLVSYAVGALLGAVFLDLLPHIFAETKNPSRIAAFILFGILAFFILEKLLLWRHHHHHGDEPIEAIAPGHGHAPIHDSGRSGWMIVIGDSFHNFTDGIIIASVQAAPAPLVQVHPSIEQACQALRSGQTVLSQAQFAHALMERAAL